MTFDIRVDVPLVSVCLITYNHAPYIRDCLDSILMQQTDFPFEICLGEDESTDGTREICIEYAEKHPDRIRLILRSQAEPERKLYEAQGNYNYVETLKACRGKYVADCDGDDAWMDPRKLQKQVDIMEADSSICLVCSDFAVANARTGEILSRHQCRDRGLSHVVAEDRKEFMFDVLKSNYKITACTTMARRSAIMDVLQSDPKLFMNFANGDTPMYCELAARGTFAYIDEPLAVYKVVCESVTQSKDPRNRLHFFSRDEDVKLYLARKHGLPTDSILRQKIKTANRLAMVEGDTAEITELYRIYRRFFPALELIAYQLARITWMRTLMRWIYCRIYSARWRAV